MKNLKNYSKRLVSIALMTAGLLLLHSASQTAFASISAPLVKRSAAPLSSSATNGKIAFVSRQSGHDEIYTVNADGSDVRQLTFDQDLIPSHPVWSPDGTKIVFVKYDAQHRGEIYLMNADGSDQKRLTQSRNDMYPTWSPDGSKIAFSTYLWPENDLYVMNADGSDQRIILSNRGQGFYTEPAWSPVGSRLAITSDDGIFVVDADGSNRTRITQTVGYGYDVEAAWSPDASRLTFSRWTDCDFADICLHGPDIWLVNADGTNITKVAENQFDSDWSPDGTKIIVSGLYLMNPDGSDITAIPNAFGYAPSWQRVPVAPSAIDDAQFFVRQHYLDFLNRQPDAEGLAFWTNEITLCAGDVQCMEVKRINVSAAYFLSIEFQETGYLVYRVYKTSYGNISGAPVPLRREEFLPDTQEIGDGVVVNRPGWDLTLENNKQNFASEFVQRSRFTSAFPTSMSPEEFVDKLFANSGVTPSADDRAEAVNEFNAAFDTADVAARARALRRVAENSTLVQQEFNRAFVLMQYFGYLRRNPNDAPDNNFSGYNFWLAKLDQFHGNYVGAEMVKSFLVSAEYRHRFGN